MDTGRISARYAKALLEIAHKTGCDRKVFEEMECISNSFMAVPEMKKAMINPHISNEERKSLLLTAAGNESTPVCALFSKFVDLVISRRRESYFQLISLQYLDLYRKANNIVIGKLTTAIEADEQIKNKMKQLVAQISNLPANGEVEFKTEVDPSIIGGFRLQVESNLLDASVSTQLQELKNSLLKKV